MNELSLFSGYGGFSLGLKLTGMPIRTVGYCEIEPYCQEIIKERIKDGYLDDAPIWPDIRAFDGKQYRGLVDIVTAGFPCQPYSFAGQRRGATDRRNLWPDTIRTIRNVGSPYVLLENVPGIANPPRECEREPAYLGTIMGQLSEAGYDAVWDVVSARDVGAPHRRDRWWLLAYPQGQRDRFIEHFPGNSRVQQNSSRWSGMGDELGDGSEDVADALNDGPYCQEGDAPQPCCHEPCNGLSERSNQWWRTEPALGRVADGTPHRVDRLKALGNGIVPAVAAEFLRRVALHQAKHQKGASQ